MDWLVGQDWGFLVRLSKQLAARQARLAVVGSRKIVRGGTMLTLGEFFGLGESLEYVTDNG